MPFTFVEIERRASRIIGPLFLAVVFFYFLTGYLVLFVAVNAWNLSASGPEPGRLVVPGGEWTAYMVLFSFLVGFGHWSFSTGNLVERICQSLGARPYDPDDGYHRIARNIVDEVAVAAGLNDLKLEVIPSASANAFALADFNGTSVIGLTEGLLCRLNRPQLEAVIAHEAGHIASGDCRDTTLTCALGEVYEEIHRKILRLLGKVRRHNHLSVILLLVVAVISLMNFLSKLLRCFISRQREIRADALSIRMTRDPQSLAEALTLIGIHWRGEGDMGERLESIFIVNPRYCALDEKEGFFADLFSSHPPISRRIRVALEMVRLSPEDISEQVVRQQQVPLAAAGVSGAPQTAGCNCPRCRKPLVRASYESAPVLNCPACGGVLASNEALRRILLRRGAGFSGEVKRLYEQLQQDKNRIVFSRLNPANAWQLQCPACQAQMHREYYNSSYPVEVDRCVGCGSIWLDRFELETIQYIYERKDEFFGY